VGRGRLRLRNNGGPTDDPDVYLVARVKDAEPARRDLATVDAMIQPRNVVLAGTSFKLVPRPSNSGIDVVYGMKDDWLWVVGGQAAHVLEIRPGGGLDTNERFRLVQDVVGSNGIALFVDGEGIRHLTEELIQGAPKSDYELRVRPFVRPLRALAASIEAERDGATHARLTLKVRK
jgi:hypothetical protein